MAFLLPLIAILLGTTAAVVAAAYLTVVATYWVELRARARHPEPPPV